MNNNRIKMRLLILFFLIVSINYSLISQLNNPFQSFPQRGNEKIDTLAIQTSEKLSKESAGLMEKEIDPTKYLLGPNDKLSIIILSATPKQHDLIVSPRGYLLIPGVGEVNLKGKTLAEAELIIKEKIKKIYKTEDVLIDLKELKKFKVSVNGAIIKPGIVAATSVDRVSEVVDKTGGLKPKASMRNIRIIRDEGKTVIKVDLMKFFMLGDKNANPTVLGGDHIIVPQINENMTIEINGDVNTPGVYEYVENDSLSTLIKFGMGFSKSSFLDSVEFYRFINNTSDMQKQFLNLSGWYKNLYSEKNTKHDFLLEPGDRVFVRKIPNWRINKTVTILGEISLPGRYPIDSDSFRVSDLITKAGGFTDEASLEDVVFIRQKELQKIDPEMERLRRMPYSEMSDNERSYFQARVNEQRGRMAINFANIMKNHNIDENISLIDEDSIFVPKLKNFINVQGRVNNPGLIIYNPSYTYETYIALAGGFGFRADEKETIIVKSKGEQFLATNKNYTIEPGDNILVPPEQNIKFIDALTTGLTIAAQLVAIIGVVLALTR